jgi:hypothetical protein
MKRLASYFRNNADDARIARMWSGVGARLDRGRPRAHLRWLALAFVATAAAASVWLAGFYPGRPAHRPGADVQLLELADGSSVEHAGDDRIEILTVTPERVELQMTQGRAVFRVTPNHDRAFLTHAAGYTIRVVGTEYTVDLGAGDVRVAVSRGRVEVRRDESGELWTVNAGEAWSSATARTAAPAAGTGVAPAPPAEASGAPPAPPALATPRRSSPPPTAAASAPPAQAPDAAALFQRAQDARAAGRPDAAARILGELLQRFPSDPRAGLAAFELGRIRLDLGDPRGAVDALDQAEGAGNSFEEQVESRRVQALEEAGDRAACRAARAAFLARFPNGAFAAVVRRRCP